MRYWAWLAAALLSLSGCSERVPKAVDHGLFSEVTLQVPSSRPQRSVLLFSDLAGWTQDEQQLAETLRKRGMFVAGIDTPALLEAARRRGGDCLFIGGDVDNLGRFVQAAARLDVSLPTTLVGIGAGSAVARLAASQAEPGSFASQVGVGTCNAPPPTGSCPAIAEAVADFHCAASIAELEPTLNRLPPVPQPPVSPLGQLPLIEQAAASAVAPELPRAQMLAILWSGDGGWAEIDRDISAALNQAGIPVVGVDALRYFWSEREASGMAADIAVIADHYAAQWRRPQLLLLGFSQGANTLPFAVQAMSAEHRARIAGVILLSPEQKASFEFQLHHWLRLGGDEPTAPAIDALPPLRVWCVAGRDDRLSVCPLLQSQDIIQTYTRGGHHLGGETPKIIADIVDALDQPSPPAAAN